MQVAITHDPALRPQYLHFGAQELMLLSLILGQPAPDWQ